MRTRQLKIGHVIQGQSQFMSQAAVEIAGLGSKKKLPKASISLWKMELHHWKIWISCEKLKVVLSFSPETNPVNTWWVSWFSPETNPVNTWWVSWFSTPTPKVLVATCPSHISTHAQQRSHAFVTPGAWLMQGLLGTASSWNPNPTV